MLYSRSELARWGLFVLIINIVLTAWTAYTRPILDYDGILYITAAKAIANDQFQLSTELYKGSFYPYLIYLSKKISTLPYTTSTYLLNSIFFTSISIAFIAIVRLLGGKNRRIMVLSLALTLFFPSLLKYRPDIFREFGFLGCYFWSIYFALRFQKDKQKINLLYWACCLAAGVLFRIESAILLIGISSLLLIQNTSVNSIKRHKKTLACLAGLFIFLLIFLVASQTFFNTHNSYIASLMYPLEYIKIALQILTDQVLAYDNGFAGTLSTIFKSISDVFYIILKRFEIIYAVLAIVAYKMRLVLTETYQRQVIGTYLALSLATLILFQMSLSYLTSRYALTFVLTALLLVPFTLEKALDVFNGKNVTHKIGVSLLLLILCFSSVKRLKFSDRHIELTTGHWISKNISVDAQVASNNSKILYYAQRFPYSTFDKNQKRTHRRFDTRLLISQRNQIALDSAQYIAFMVRPKLELDVKQEKVFTAKFGEPIKRLYQAEGPYVNIYKQL